MQTVPKAVRRGQDWDAGDDLGGEQLTASLCVARVRRLRRLARGAYGDGDLPPVSTESRRHRRWCVWFDDCLSHPEQAPSDAV